VSADRRGGGVDIGKPMPPIEWKMPAGVPRHVPPAQLVVPERDEHALEKQEQVEVRKLLIAYGFKVYNLSQARASKQSPGLPDLWCVHTREPVAFWFETKRQVGGKLSPPQLEFQAECLRCEVRHFVGDRHSAAALLLSLGLAEPGPRESAYALEPVHR
jgi:hypothetical protein